MNGTAGAAMTTPALKGKTPQGPRGNFLFGNMTGFMKDSLGFLQAMQSYGDVARYRTGPWTWYQVNHPDGVEHVLQENNHNYIKGSLMVRLVGPVAGNGLLLSEGEFWLRQRRLMQPAFHRQRIAAFGELMTAATGEMLKSWQAHAGSGKPVDLLVEMTRLTAEVVTGALFSTHVRDESRAIATAITTLIEDIGFRYRMPLYPPPAVPTPRNRRQQQALRTLDRATHAIIAERRQTNLEGDDLLSMLLQARDAETGQGMSDKQLRDEVTTLFIAGHETTANALTWTFYLLSQHPDAERRLHDELDAVLAGRPPAVGDLPALPYTRMVIDEAMRLYPPIWITSRQAIAADEICGYHIPAGALVSVSPYVMHRHPAYWADPEWFDPERFSPERSKDRPHYAYFPFGGGPRLCIGRSFALMEAPLVLATIAQQYRLRLAPGRRVVPETLLTLRPRDGLPMTIERRSHNVNGAHAPL